MFKYSCDAELRNVDTNEYIDTCEVSIDVLHALDNKQQYACMVILNGLDSDEFTYWSLRNMKENNESAKS